MPRPSKARKPAGRGRGRTQQAVERAVRASANRSREFHALEALAVGAAREYDRLAAADDPYALVHVGRFLLELLTVRQLTPGTSAAAAGADDELALLLKSLAPQTTHG